MTPLYNLLLIILAAVFFILGLLEGQVFRRKITFLLLSTGFFLLSAVDLAGGENAEMGVVCLGMAFLSGALTAAETLGYAAR